MPEWPIDLDDLIVAGADAERLETLGRLGRDWVASAFAADRVQGLLGKALL